MVRHDPDRRGRHHPVFRGAQPDPDRRVRRRVDARPDPDGAAGPRGRHREPRRGDDLAVAAHRLRRDLGWRPHHPGSREEDPRQRPYRRRHRSLLDARAHLLHRRRGLRLRERADPRRHVREPADALRHPRPREGLRPRGAWHLRHLPAPLPDRSSHGRGHGSGEILLGVHRGRARVHGPRRGDGVRACGLAGSAAGDPGDATEQPDARRVADRGAPAGAPDPRALPHGPQPRPAVDPARRLRPLLLPRGRVAPAPSRRQVARPPHGAVGCRDARAALHHERRSQRLREVPVQRAHDRAHGAHDGDSRAARALGAHHPRAAGDQQARGWQQGRARVDPARGALTRLHVPREPDRRGAAVRLLALDFYYTPLFSWRRPITSGTSG